ncbi:ABC transporter permease [Peribacillus huizhouensis]|uniref:ABC-2 type transport system permease protein n=1 Tax=Peribacillus huizhouensis TaxID=1501239 RepID=A0ABR6CR09_9BACI|nr:ABC transporter permease [Peribacillus huizhouensis]MBA9027073.1 ABC-2 type transport system permease protein [Peribacillus huizhouensis]
MRTVAVIKRICQEMLRDKRTLALLFVAPLIILTLMYFLFNGNTVDPKLGVVNIDNNLVKILEETKINVKHYDQAGRELIVEEELDGLLELKDEKLVLTLQNSDPSIAKALQMKVNQSVSFQAQSKVLNSNAAPLAIQKNDIDTQYVYGNSETSFFDVLSPVLVGFFVFFFVFLISGIGLLKERTTGTLERLMSTPIRRGEIVTAYLVGFGIFAVIQTVIVVLFSINVLDMVLVGSVWHVILINLLLALVALSLGTLLSTFAASEFQMVQFIPIAVIPQVFFAGIFPLEGMANWLQSIGKIMPIYYAADALKGVMYKGLGLKDISGDLFVLVVFATFFIILNIFALKKYRRL